MAQTVVGIFDSAREAQDAVEKLMDKGFSRDQVDLSTSTMSDAADYNTGSTNYNTGSTTGMGSTSMGTTGSSTTYDRDSDYNRSRNRDRDDDGWGIGDFFSSLFGGDNDETRTYSEVGSRSSIVTVHAMSRDEAERAVDILDDCGAVDVNERASQYQSDYQSGYSAGGRTAGLTSTDLDSTNMTTSGMTTSDADMDLNRTTNMDYDRTRDIDRTIDSDQRIPIIEEQLNVGKQEVETGRVRVRSRIIERPVEENLRLRVERVHVHRNPVNRPASEADLSGFREGEIELTQHEERAITSKEARVVEEVSLSKDVEERVETVRDTVRRTEVDVDDTTTGNITNDANLRTGNTYGTDDYDSNTTTGNRPTNL